MTLRPEKPTIGPAGDAIRAGRAANAADHPVVAEESRHSTPARGSLPDLDGLIGRVAARQAIVSRAMAGDVRRRILEPGSREPLIRPIRAAATTVVTEVSPGASDELPAPAPVAHGGSVPAWAFDAGALRSPSSRTPGPSAGGAVDDPAANAVHEALTSYPVAIDIPSDRLVADVASEPIVTGSKSAAAPAIRSLGNAAGRGKRRLLLTALAVLTLAVGVLTLKFVPSASTSSTPSGRSDTANQSVGPAGASSTPVVARVAIPDPTRDPAKNEPTGQVQSSPVPALARLAAPAQVASSAAGRGVVYEAGFAGGSAGWPDEPGGPARWAGGAYRLTAPEPGRFVALDAPVAGPLGDVVVRARFRKLGGPPGGGYGLILRGQAPGARDGRAQGGRYYVLEAGDRGEAGIWRREGDRWVDLVPWTAAAAVRPGGEPNDLEAEARGDRLTLRVNGAVVAEVTDAALGPGAVGVFIGGDLNDVALDSFSVDALK